MMFEPIQLPPIDIQAFLVNNVIQIIITIIVSAAIAANYTKWNMRIGYMALSTPFVYFLLSQVMEYWNADNWSNILTLGIVGLLVFIATRKNGK